MPNCRRHFPWSLECLLEKNVKEPATNSHQWWCVTRAAQTLMVVTSCSSTSLICEGQAAVRWDAQHVLNINIYDMAWAAVSLLCAMFFISLCNCLRQPHLRTVYVFPSGVCCGLLANTAVSNTFGIRTIFNGSSFIFSTGWWMSDWVVMISYNGGKGCGVGAKIAVWTLFFMRRHSPSSRLSLRSCCSWHPLSHHVWCE